MAARRYFSRAGGRYRLVATTAKSNEWKPELPALVRAAECNGMKKKSMATAKVRLTKVLVMARRVV